MMLLIGSLTVLVILTFWSQMSSADKIQEINKELGKLIDEFRSKTKGE